MQGEKGNPEPRRNHHEKRPPGGERHLPGLPDRNVQDSSEAIISYCFSPIKNPEELIDAFYYSAINEALGFLGSKIINHKRKCNHEEYFLKLYKKLSKSKSNLTID